MNSSVVGDLGCMPETLIVKKYKLNEVKTTVQDSSYRPRDLHFIILMTTDMVELMLMQNAQMHQIIMHNMMLKALPLMAVSPGGIPSHITPHTASHSGQVTIRGYCVEYT